MKGASSPRCHSGRYHVAFVVLGAMVLVLAVSGTALAADLPTPTVTLPDSAGPFSLASTVPVAWTVASPATTGTFHIFAFASDTYYYLASQAATGLGSYTYDWIVSQPTGTGYVIRVWYMDDLGNWLFFDDSSPTFAITGSTHQISGQVLGNSGGSVTLEGATVTVRLNAADPNYDSLVPANNLVGTETSDVDGHYVIDVSGFRGTGLPIGSVVDVSASMTGYLSVLQYGEYDRPVTTCSFLRFNVTIGAPWEDRRLPFDTGQQPPLPCVYLLPNYVTPIP